MNEDDVRKWLRNQAKDIVRWCEPAKGGSQGNPDATLPVPAGTLELELKCWKFTKEGKLCCAVRPVQRRYHFMAARHGRLTGFLIGIQFPQQMQPDEAWEKMYFLDGLLPEDFVPDQFILGIFPGRTVPLQDFPPDGPPIMGVVRNLNDIKEWTSKWSRWYQS